MLPFITLINHNKEENLNELRTIVLMMTNNYKYYLLYYEY